MVLHVQYPDNKYDYVSSRVIDGLIDQKLIRMFFRPSEGTWVDIEAGAIRRPSNVFYIGEERRAADLIAA